MHFNLAQGIKNPDKMVHLKNSYDEKDFESEIEDNPQEKALPESQKARITHLKKSFDIDHDSRFQALEKEMTTTKKLKAEVERLQEELTLSKTTAALLKKENSMLKSATATFSNIVWRYMDELKFQMGCSEGSI